MRATGCYWLPLARRPRARRALGRSLHPPQPRRSGRCAPARPRPDAGTGYLRWVVRRSPGCSSSCSPRAGRRCSPPWPACARRCLPRGGCGARVAVAGAGSARSVVAAACRWRPARSARHRTATRAFPGTDGPVWPVYVRAVAGSPRGSGSAQARHRRGHRLRGPAGMGHHAHNLVPGRAGPRYGVVGPSLVLAASSLAALAIAVRCPARTPRRAGDRGRCWSSRDWPHDPRTGGTRRSRWRC